MTNLCHLLRVLIVEDEALISLDLEATLLDAGVRDVVSASSAETAMQALERSTFDAAILDLHLGRGGWSYDVARRLQQMGVPFIFSSGSVGAATGFDGVPMVTKPFSSEQLLAALFDASADREQNAAQ